VLAGEADLYFALPLEMGGGKLKIWDLAASAAITRAVGAKLTDAFGNELDLTGQSGYIYDHGLILARDASIHERCLEVVREVCQ
jgi:3'-phosphoadenosine 5'-phosphosulfate (PAPS) 3'-phosphatase